MTYVIFHIGQIIKIAKGRYVYIVKKYGGHAVVFEITKTENGIRRDSKGNVVSRRADKFEGEIDLAKHSHRFGLRHESTIRVSQQAKILLKDLAKAIGHLDNDTIDYIDEVYKQLKNNKKVGLYKLYKTKYKSPLELRGSKT